MDSPTPRQADPAQWERIKELFSAALARTGEQRSGFLRLACAGDDALYGQVALLLSHDHAAGSFLASEVLTGAAGQAPEENPDGVLAPGDLIAGRFRILGMLGRGGMGEVYEAGDLERNFRVALKTLPRLEAARLYRFKQEFRSLAGIAHPNLVSLYELVGEDNKWFFTMELLAGQDLLAFVAREPATAGRSQTEMRCEPGKLREALAQVAEGLAVLHAANKLHCDIKPANVMVTPGGRAVLLDFGLASDRGEAPGSRGTAGTIAYMSPEQATGAPLAEASDWYAFGVMLFQALTGVLPFNGPGHQIIRDKQKLDAPFASALVTGIPRDLADLCDCLLRRDPGLRPRGQEIQARLRISGGHARLAPAFDSGSFFVGRTRELDLLAGAAARSRLPQVVVAFVHGSSGTGKSTLIEHYLSGLAADEAMILRGRCYEQESVPYKAIDDSVDALCRYLAGLPAKEQAEILPEDTSVLARLFPVFRQLLLVEARAGAAHPFSDPQELRRRGFRSLRRLLARVAGRQPVIMYIDDLQWGDADGAQLLGELLADEEPAPLLLICSWRREHVGRSVCLETILEAADRNRIPRVDIPVEPLSPGESRELALKFLGSGGGPDGTRGDRIARESGGNAYFIRELAQRAGGGPADSLPGLIAARVTGLPESSRRLLEIIALHGRPLTQADAFTAGAFGHSSLATLAPLRAGNLIRIAGARHLDEVETFHDQIRETVAGMIGPEARPLYHRGLAAALEASGRADAETLAVHFAGSGDAVKAAGLYRSAADQAAGSLAFERAARLYRIALDQAVASPDAEALLRRKLAESLSNSGRGIEAAREYEHAARLKGPAERLTLERNAAYHYCAGGYVDRGKAVFGEVLNEVGLHLPRGRFSALAVLIFRRLALIVRGAGFRERAEAEVPAGLLDQVDTAWAAGAGLVMADQTFGMALTSLSMLLALQSGEPVRIVRSIMLEASNIAAEGQTGVGRSRRLLDIGHRLVARHDRPSLRGWILMGEGGVAFLLGQWTRCAENMEQAEAIFSAQCTGVVWELASARMLILYSLFNCGNLLALQRRSPVLLREAGDREDLYSYATIATFSEPMVLAMANRPDAARDLVRASLARWQERARGGHHLQHVMGALTLVWLDFFDGKSECGPGFLDEQWRLLQRNFFDRVLVLRVYYLDAVVRTALRMAARDTGTGSREKHLRAAGKAVAALRSERTELGRAYAATGAAGVAAERGDRNAAISRMGNAVMSFGRLGMSGHFWSARRRLGELTGGPDGQRAIEEADAWLVSNRVEDPARFAQMLAGYNALS